MMLKVDLTPEELALIEQLVSDHVGDLLKIASDIREERVSNDIRTIAALERVERKFKIASSLGAKIELTGRCL